MPAGAAQEFVQAWDPHVPGLREVFHARFVDHAYPPHTHGAWTVLIVDTGAVRYALDRHEHGALGRAVTVLPPPVTHAGRSATAGGFSRFTVTLSTGLAAVTAAACARTAFMLEKMTALRKPRL